MLEKSYSTGETWKGTLLNVEEHAGCGYEKQPLFECHEHTAPGLYLLKFIKNYNILNFTYNLMNLFSDFIQ